MKIGPYKLISELGLGGMAQVWLAHQEWIDDEPRVCVLKMPRRKAIADEGQLRQFLQEARLSKRLRHNNIVSISDAGIHDGLPYIVMDFVAGVDLQRLHRAAGEPWPLALVACVVRSVAKALHYAHNLDDAIIHRDVSSKNVMVDGTGGALLMDFGIATSLSSLTSKIHIKGTLSYMAPEHYLGQACAGSDVFGLGVILWELLSGRRFRAGLEGEALGQAIVQGEIEPIRREIPEKVQRLLQGMLERDAKNRISLAEVLQALKDYADGSNDLARMVAYYFGRAGRRTGHSQAHFTASKELLDTFAVARASGVSLDELRQRSRPGAPPRIPLDFERVAAESTLRVDPPGAEDDDLHGDSVPATALGVGAGREPDAPLPGGTLRLAAPCLPPTADAAPTPTIRLECLAAREGTAAWNPSLDGPEGEVQPDAPVEKAWPPSPLGEITSPPAPSVRGETEPHSYAWNGAQDEGARPRSAGGTRRRGATLAAAGSIVAVLAGVGGWWLSVREPEPAPEPAQGIAAVVSPPSPTPSPAMEIDEVLPTVMPSPSRRNALDVPELSDEHVEVTTSTLTTAAPEPIDPAQAPTPTEDELEPVAEVAPRPSSRPKNDRPVVRLPLVVRRGIAVAFAEIRVGNGKIHEVPPTGAATLRVREGTHTMRFRTEPNAPWRTSRHTFSAGMKYAGHVENSGVRILGARDEDG